MFYIIPKEGEHKELPVLTVLLLFFTTVLILGILQHNQEQEMIYLRLQYASICNMALIGLTLLADLIVIGLKKEKTTYTNDEIVNNYLSMRKAEKSFNELMEKYVIKNDEEYHQLKRKRKIMSGIVFGLIVVMLSGYLPVFIRYGELIPLVNSYTIRLSLEVKSFRDLLLAKAVLDLMVQIPLIIIAYTYKKKKLTEKKNNLYRSFHEYLRNEIGLKERSLSRENQTFKGVELAEKQAIALAKRKRESLGPKEEIALLLDHARLLINRKRNYRKNFAGGVVTVIALIASVMILAQLEKYYLNFLYLFLLLTTLVYLAVRKKAGYHYKAQKVLALE